MSSSVAKGASKATPHMKRLSNTVKMIHLQPYVVSEQVIDKMAEVCREYGLITKRKGTAELYAQIDGKDKFCCQFKAGQHPKYGNVLLLEHSMTDSSDIWAGIAIALVIVLVGVAVGAAVSSASGGGHSHGGHSGGHCHHSSSYVPVPAIINVSSGSSLRKGQKKMAPAQFFREMFNDIGKRLKEMEWVVYSSKAVELSLKLDSRPLLHAVDEQRLTPLQCVTYYVDVTESMIHNQALRIDVVASGRVRVLAGYEMMPTGLRRNIIKAVKRTVNGKQWHHQIQIAGPTSSQDAVEAKQRDADASPCKECKGKTQPLKAGRYFVAVQSVPFAGTQSIRCGADIVQQDMVHVPSLAMFGSISQSIVKLPTLGATFKEVEPGKDCVMASDQATLAPSQCLPSSDSSSDSCGDESGQDNDEDWVLVEAVNPLKSTGIVPDSVLLPPRMTHTTLEDARRHSTLGLVREIQSTTTMQQLEALRERLTGVMADTRMEQRVRDSVQIHFDARFAFFSQFSAASAKDLEAVSMDEPSHHHNGDDDGDDDDGCACEALGEANVSAASVIAIRGEGDDNGLIRQASESLPAYEAHAPSSPPPPPYSDTCTMPQVQRIHCQQ
eukprot:m.306009 g.306009  ORF g.306009 m.306009 type:complete len:610 (+) comp15914_c1_seq5:171-2000(+)